MVGGKEVPRSNGEIGAYVAKVLPGGAAEQTGKILEGNLLLLFLIMNFGLAKYQLFMEMVRANWEPYLAGTGGTAPWRTPGRQNSFPVNLTKYINKAETSCSSKC